MKYTFANKEFKDYSIDNVWFLRVLNLAKYLNISPNDIYNLDYEFITRLEIYISEENLHKKREEIKSNLKNKKRK